MFITKFSQGSNIDFPDKGTKNGLSKYLKWQRMNFYSFFRTWYFQQFQRDYFFNIGLKSLNHGFL